MSNENHFINAVNILMVCYLDLSVFHPQHRYVYLDNTIHSFFFYKDVFYKKITAEISAEHF